MTTQEATTKAKATLHLKIVRANGAVEELDVPVTTDLTKEQVRELIARQFAAGAGGCGQPATASIQGRNGGWTAVCEQHLQVARDAATVSGLGITAQAATGLCSVRED